MEHFSLPFNVFNVAVLLNMDALSLASRVCELQIHISHVPVPVGNLCFCLKLITKQQAILFSPLSNNELFLH